MHEIKLYKAQKSMDAILFVNNCGRHVLEMLENESLCLAEWLEERSNRYIRYPVVSTRAAATPQNALYENPWCKVYLDQMRAWEDCTRSKALKDGEDNQAIAWHA